MPNQATKAKQYQHTLDSVRWLHSVMIRSGRPTENQLNLYAKRLAQRMTEAELKRWQDTAEGAVKLYTLDDQFKIVKQGERDAQEE